MSEALTAGLRRAAKYLARFQSGVVPHFIADAPTLSRSGTTFDTLDPGGNQKQATVASGEAADIDAAARGGGRLPCMAVLSGAIADAIEAPPEEIAQVESCDTGQPIRYMAKAALRDAENFRFYTDRAPCANDGRAMPNEDHLN